VEALKDPYIV